jgi:hypothetical protein
MIVRNCGERAEVFVPKFLSALTNGFGGIQNSQSASMIACKTCGTKRLLNGYVAIWPTTPMRH